MLSRLRASVVARCVPVVLLLGLQLCPAETTGETETGWLKPNLQKAQPVNHLQFSAAPGVQEIFRARVFEEPLVPIQGEPSPTENAELASALLGYARRNGPDDFSSLTTFLQEHPDSAWDASLLTCLGIEYYNTAHYSLALDAWARGWALAKDVHDPLGKAVGDRAAGELAYMYARLGRMTELEALLNSVAGRAFVGPATQKITGAREGLWSMKNQPGVSFCCGPMALQRIKLSKEPLNPCDPIIRSAASTQKGFSLSAVAELSKKLDLNYQMAFREKGGPFVVPSVVHWKVGHYAALVRREGDRFLLEDPTFGNTVWATQQALEQETSGYFLVPPGSLRKNWRAVDMKEGETVWGKGKTDTCDPKDTTPCTPSSGGAASCSTPCPRGGGGGGGGFGTFSKIQVKYTQQSPMTVSTVHLMTVNLHLWDTPVGYVPPVGPPIHFTVRYNHRDAFQPTLFTYSNFGPKWTCDWLAYITDTPTNVLADVNYYVRGGGTRTFTGFDTNSQTFTFQQFDQTHLKRTGSASYEMQWPDGSKLVFAQSDGSVGTTRKIFLTQILDPAGNAVSLGYDGNLRLVSITDAINQTTTLTYGATNDIYKITQVTDPFGRFASFYYDSLGRLTNITDVIGITSQFSYQTNGDFINALTTPYGTSSFISADNGNTRRLDTIYPDGSSDRVEYNQSTALGIADSDPGTTVPVGMGTLFNAYLYARNTYYWSRTANALAPGDYTKARIYHWLHNLDTSQTSGILESIKEPLENRVWFTYPGQSAANIVGSLNKPAQVGRVLDDGTTQIRSSSYNGFGRVTNTVDPAGRTFSYIYDTNGIDLLEVRMTRAGKNELLYRASYNSQHLPLTTIDAAGQTNSYTYNSRGQVLTQTNPKNEITRFGYDTNGYLTSVDGALPGTNDVTILTYDSFGRVRTKTDVSGYTLTFDYDAIDRITKVTHPDSTFEQITYERLDPVIVQDRAKRQTLLEYDALRQMRKRTDPLNRVIQFQWCSCGDIKSLTDPMGRTTTWQKDVQNRLASKQYSDGTQVLYNYEKTTSRLREVVDEKLQRTEFAYNIDDSLRARIYANSTVPTPAVTFTYDADYDRPASMTDGTGTTLYQYVPITVPPVLGAGKIASQDGPLQNDTITYIYDELGRRVGSAINGVGGFVTLDAAGRVTSETNALGAFTYGYDGASGRLVSQVFPNGQVITEGYGDNALDRILLGVTNVVGATPLSQFGYVRDVAGDRVNLWSQQSDVALPNVYTLSYDAANQLLSASVTNASGPITSFGYSYDPAGNRLSEQAGASSTTATYNVLNELSTISGGNASSRTNEWDGKNRLVAVDSGSQTTQLAYDGPSHLASITVVTNGAQASFRQFIWSGDELREERDGAGAVTKRFFRTGVQIVSGTNAGLYFYTRDHLGSIRELVDGAGNVRTRYTYDPFGRRTRIAGDLDTDFGFAGMFLVKEAGLYAARFRVYDPELGRWLSRDPLRDTEEKEGPNLYSYVANNPVNNTDLLGLKSEKCCEYEEAVLNSVRGSCIKSFFDSLKLCNFAQHKTPEIADEVCAERGQFTAVFCVWTTGLAKDYARDYITCVIDNNCDLPCSSPPSDAGQPPCSGSQDPSTDNCIERLP